MGFKYNRVPELHVLEFDPLKCGGSHILQVDGKVVDTTYGTRKINAIGMFE